MAVTFSKLNAPAYKIASFENNHLPVVQTLIISRNGNGGSGFTARDEL